MRSPALEADELPDVSVWLGGGQGFVVCAFYTPDYEGKVRRLKASLERFGLNFHLQRFDKRLTWEATTRLKAGFVADCLAAYPGHDILYLDADAVVRQAPDFLNEVSGDVGILFAPVKSDGKRRLSIAAGTLFVRNTRGGRRFAEIWRNNEKNVGAFGLDEDMIYEGFEDFAGISFTALPRSYSKIFDSPGPDPVIEHFQASRAQFKVGKVARRIRRAMLTGSIVSAFIVVTVGLLRLAG